MDDEGRHESARSQGQGLARPGRHHPATLPARVPPFPFRPEAVSAPASILALIPYSLTFDDRHEVRMGSPFKVARVRLNGEFVPELRGDFQDVGAVSSDGRTCYLVEWLVEGNEPGFSVWRLSEAERTAQASPRISGCCVDLIVEEDRVRAVAWAESGRQVVAVEFE